MAQRDFISKLARAVLKAQAIRTDSFDASTKTHTKSDQECAEQACNELNMIPDIGKVVEFLNKNSWIDAQLWALDILDIEDQEDGR